MSSGKAINEFITVQDEANHAQEFLISNFRHAVNVVFFLLSDSPESEF